MSTCTPSIQPSALFVNFMKQSVFSQQLSGCVCAGQALCVSSTLCQHDASWNPSPCLLALEGFVHAFCNMMWGSCSESRIPVGSAVLVVARVVVFNISLPALKYNPCLLVSQVPEC